MYGRLAQLGERSLDVRKVVGSSPIPSIFVSCVYAQSRVNTGCFAAHKRISAHIYARYLLDDIGSAFGGADIFFKVFYIYCLTLI